jgi:hypothetical protein
MRLVLPHGGYGLGNDLIPWAKGFLLSQETGAALLHPAWGRNPRRYWRHFGTSRLDVHLHRALVRLLPRVAFTEEVYRELGFNDFPSACRGFAERFRLRERRAWVVTVTGPWGAFAGLERARPFVNSVLWGSKYVRRNLSWLEARRERRRLAVMVHVRRGDFRTAGPGESFRDALNTAVPIEWYESVCRALVAALGEENLQFCVASDGTANEIGRFLEKFDCIFTSSQANSDCSDLLALAGGDLLVCSPSTYSMWAAFLSDSPYIWFAPQLEPGAHGRGLRWVRSLLADQGVVRRPAATAPPRGNPIGIGECLPDSLLQYLRTRLAQKADGTDLVRGGLVADAIS